MNLLNNWLVQAIIGNLVCFLLSKIAMWFIKNTNSTNTTTNTPYKHSKKTLKKQFYISLVIAITSIPIFFFTSDVLIKSSSFWGIILGLFFAYCAFECALDSFDDSPSDRNQ